MTSELPPDYGMDSSVLPPRTGTFGDGALGPKRVSLGQRSVLRRAGAGYR